MAKHRNRIPSVQPINLHELRRAKKRTVRYRASKLIIILFFLGMLLPIIGVLQNANP